MMHNPTELAVITFNIQADFLTWAGVPTWEERKMLCVQALRQAQPSLIGLQEVMPNQFDFLQSHLAEFTAITVTETTTDKVLLEAVQQHYGLPLPERNEVILFFRTTVFDQVAGGYWWLSPTPDRLSTGFGNIAPRLVLWARLRHKASGRELIALNTHLDNRALQPMVQMCQEKVAEFVDTGLPVIFMGDFNLDSTQAEYRWLTGDGWRDTYTVASSGSREAQLSTYRDRRRVDHILVQGDTLTPQQWQRLTSPDPERRLSDHDPVMVRFWLHL